MGNIFVKGTSLSNSYILLEHIKISSIKQWQLAKATLKRWIWSDVRPENSHSSKLHEEDGNTACCLKAWDFF